MWVKPPSCPTLAEPSVYLPSREWHQQPGPQEVRQRGLPSTGLPARVTQPTQKSKPMKIVELIRNSVCSCFYHGAVCPQARGSLLPYLSFHSPRHPLWPPMRRWTMCKSTKRRPRLCKAPCRSGPMCGSLLNLPRGSSPDTDTGRRKKKRKKIPILSQASPVSCFYHYYEYWLGLFKTEIFGQ